MHFVVPQEHIHITNNQHLVLGGKYGILYYQKRKNSNSLQKIYCSSLGHFTDPVRSDKNEECSLWPCSPGTEELQCHLLLPSSHLSHLEITVLLVLIAYGAMQANTNLPIHLTIIYLYYFHMSQEHIFPDTHPGWIYFQTRSKAKIKGKQTIFAWV